MAHQPKQAGFLTKMVKMIRATAQTKPQEAQESVSSVHSEQEKVALRARIERKRRDDIVRRREFTYLRNVRAGVPLSAQAASMRSSAFQSSSGFTSDEQSLGARIDTVRKIDAIEAQMSKFWSDRKRGIAPEAAPAVAPPKANPAPQPSSTPPDDADLDLDFTGLLAGATSSEDARAPDPQASAASAGPIPAPPAPVHPEEEWPSSYSISRQVSVDMGDHAENPALQDAAIRFAEGDDDGAEAALLAVLQSPDSGDEAAEACSAALLDLYRATGQQASFDVVAIEYAQLFGRSAPEWFDVSDVLKANQSTEPGQPSPAATVNEKAVWESPEVFGLSEVAQLRSMAGLLSNTQLHWAGLRTIAQEAAQPLLDLFRYWAEQPIELHFSDEAVFGGVLALATPVENKDIDPVWWSLRLEFLRLQGEQAAFEEVALDFCVTYEVSPPSWVETLCTLVHEQTPSQFAAMVVDVGGVPTITPSLEMLQLPASLELSGALLGDVARVMARLLGQTRAGEPMVVSCARLVRVDFSAAGSILNWVVENLAEGRAVQFVNVPRLIAAFFDVVGISAHVRVLTGKR